MRALLWIAAGIGGLYVLGEVSGALREVASIYRDTRDVVSGVRTAVNSVAQTANQIRGTVSSVGQTIRDVSGAASAIANGLQGVYDTSGSAGGQVGGNLVSNFDAWTWPQANDATGWDF